MLKDILLSVVEWCNDNQGFLSAVLSVFSLLLSVLALIFTYKIGKMPFIKKIAVTPFLYKDCDEYYLDIMLVNIGAVPVIVQSIRITNNSDLEIGMDNIGLEPLILEPNNVERMKIRLFDDIENIEENEMDLNNHIKIQLHEYGGKIHEWKNGFPVGERYTNHQYSVVGIFVLIWRAL